jgi:2,3-bisphosphoglycerate-independent phosphoglycerate mutase
MDRDNRWDRVEQAYRLLTESHAEYTAKNATEALDMAYLRDEDDEFVSATSILFNDEPVAIADGDALIFMNFRADRAREISRAFVDTDFSGFERKLQPNCHFVMTTEYADSIDAPCAFPPEKLNNVLGEYLEKNNKTQLRIAETEKYAHVTFFFSGGREALFTGEDRELIPSPDVATYDLQPEMSAPEVTEKLVRAIKSGKYDVVICNYANGDMVGHTGNLNAAIKASEAIDKSIKAVTDAIIEVDGHCLITADHGNCEQMADHESGQAHTAHTCELVPLIYVSNHPAPFVITNGRLADIAPTLLALMGMTPPDEMTGRVLLSLS